MAKKKATTTHAKGTHIVDQASKPNVPEHYTHFAEQIKDTAVERYNIRKAKKGEGGIRLTTDTGGTQLMHCLQSWANMDRKRFEENFDKIDWSK